MGPDIPSLPLSYCLLEGKELIRPGTFQFANNLLRTAGGRLTGVRITKISSDETIYAEAIVDVDGRTVTIDARPSDALNLAMLIGAPVTIEANLLQVMQGRIQGYITDDGVLARVYPDGPHELVAEYEHNYIKPRGETSGVS
jgi:bifunctional DNase/RNase